MISITSTTTAAAIATAANDEPAAADTPHTDHAAAATTIADPLAKFGPHDLHQSVQQFARFGGGQGEQLDTLLARYAPQGDRRGDAGGTAAPLYQRQVQPTGAQAQPIAAPAIPNAPIDVRRMETLNATVQRFNISRSPVDADDLRATQRKFQAATDALKAGDYKKAEQALRSLGFPLPAPSSKDPLPYAGALTAIMLGAPVHARRGGGWDMPQVNWGARGNQALNDVNGFAANAIMINRMASAPGGVSNPPTEGQATKYMKEFAQPAKGKPPTVQQVMQAASEITNGSIMHYSSAGARNPTYGNNPNQHAFYRDRSGQMHEFDSVADAVRAARAGNPPMERGGRVTPIVSRSPDEWSDIATPGTRAGRYIGDCESKVYLQTRLLTAAGFTSLGSADVQRRDGGSGHMFGVFKATDGTLWVTSNEEFRQVRASDASKGVTQADLDTTLREMTAELYHIEPNFKGELDLSEFRFAAAATVNQSGANAAIDTIRRSTELNVLGRSETLIPTPVVK